MCWNEPVSWLTFFIGTFLNVYNICYFKNKVITRLSLAVQWLLMMQFFEAIAWRNQNVNSKSECNSTNTFATYGALIFNLTQPIVLCLLFLDISPVLPIYKNLAIGVMLTYICYLFYALNRSKTFNCLKPSSQCSHLDLVWWKSISAIPYHIALFATLILLVRPVNIMMFAVAYIAIAFILSMMFYSCGVGSMWCWFVAFIPIFVNAYGKKI